jgi:hypothetical protein
MAKRLNDVSFTTLTNPKNDMYMHVLDQDDTLDKNIIYSDLTKAINSVNDFINGPLDVWQRGNTFTGITNGTFGPDRIEYCESSSAVVDLTRSTDVPDERFNYSMKLTVTTNDASIGAAEFVYFRQLIEGYNYKKYVNSYGRLGFHIKTNKTGTYCISYANNASDRSYVQEYTISSANSWQFVPLPTVLFDETGGTWDYNTGVGLKINFTLAAGSNFQTTADAWQTGSFLSTSNQTNGVDTISNEFYFTGITFNVGNQYVSDYDYDYNNELTRCKRYFQRLNIGGTTLPLGYIYGTGGTSNNRGFISLPVEMRVLPTVSQTGTVNAIGQGAVVTINSLVGQDLQEHGIGLYINTASSLTNLELYTIACANATIDFDAEL